MSIDAYLFCGYTTAHSLKHGILDSDQVLV